MACLPLGRFVQLFVVFAASATLIRASYYLDETDSNISYTGDYWNYVNVNFLDRTKLYNGGW